MQNITENSIEIKEYEIGDSERDWDWDSDYDEAHTRPLIPGVKHSLLQIFFKGTLRKQYMFLDLTDGKNACLFDEIKNKFSTFQRNCLAPHFFSLPDIARYNFSFVFVVDDDFQNSFQDIETNLDYAIKYFVKKSELGEFKKYITSFPNQDFKSSISYEDKNFDLGISNLIYGYNSTGKTKLLKRIADEFALPIFTPMGLTKEELGIIREKLQTCNKELVEKYVDLLTKSYFLPEKNIENFGDMDREEQSIIALALFLSENAETNDMLLIDDTLAINGSDIFTLNLMETLFHHQNPTVTTSCLGQYPDLFYVKSLKPNIIDLNETPLFR